MMSAAFGLLLLCFIAYHVRYRYKTGRVIQGQEVKLAGLEGRIEVLAERLQMADFLVSQLPHLIAITKSLLGTTPPKPGREVPQA